MARQNTDRKITIYDIADRVGASPSTVGAVMNGSWKARRISADRATHIERIAGEMGYAPNLQASALRSDRSRIIGMIMPMNDNRYFGSIAEAFERGARARGLMPITSCTLRDPALEIATVRQMLAYQLDLIVCTGATDPDGIARLCATHNVPTINLDLPGTAAPSIISDNYAGAVKMTEEIIARADDLSQTWRDDMVVVGGRAGDHNTRERVRGVTDGMRAAGAEPRIENILTCGYAADKAEAAFAAHVDKQGTVPSALFVNSAISLEGIVRWLNRHQRDALETMVLGSFDWDPFAQYIAKNVVTIRQDAPAMLDAMFKLIDSGEMPQNHLIEIEPIVVANDRADA